MHRLYLVRHAQTRIDPTRPPYEWDLDPAGAGLLEEMASLPHWSSAYRVVTSTEPKAIKTAEAIIAKHPLPLPEPMDALRELHKFGFVEGHDAAIARVFADPTQPAVEGWETGAAGLARFGACMDRLISMAGDRDLIVVSHGNILSLYLADLAGQAQVNLADWKAIGMPDYAVIDTATMKLIQPFGAWRR